MKLTEAQQYFSKVIIEDPLTKFVVALFAGLMDYLLPGEAVRALAISAFFAVLLDTATGMRAAWINPNIKISSAKFGRVFTKFLGYGSVVAISAIIAKGLPGLGPYQTTAASVILSLILVRESMSVLENVKRMDVDVPFADVLLKQLASIEKGERDKTRHDPAKPDV